MIWARKSHFIPVSLLWPNKTSFATMPLCSRSEPHRKLSLSVHTCVRTHTHPVGLGVPSSLLPPLATKTPESSNISNSFLCLSHQPFLSPFAKTQVFVLQLSLSELFQGWLANSSIARVRTWGKEPMQGRLLWPGVRWSR